MEGWITGGKTELWAGTKGGLNRLLAVTDKGGSIKGDFEPGSFLDFNFLFGFGRGTTSMDGPDMRGFVEVPFLGFSALEPFMVAFVGVEMHESTDAGIPNGPKVAKEPETTMIFAQANAAVSMIIKIPEGWRTEPMHVALVGDPLAICVKTFATSLTDETHLA